MNPVQVQVQVNGGILTPLRSGGGSAVSVSGMDPFAQIIQNMTAQMQESEQQALEGQTPASGGKQEKNPIGFMEEIAGMALINPGVMWNDFVFVNQEATGGVSTVPMQAEVIPGVMKTQDGAVQTSIQELLQFSQQGNLDVSQLIPVEGQAQKEAEVLAHSLLQQMQVMDPQVQAAGLKTPAAGPLAQILPKETSPKGTAPASEHSPLFQVDAETGELPVTQVRSGGTAGEKSGEQELFTMEHQFRNAVDTAKSRIGKASFKEVAEIDVDQLQSQVNLQRTESGIAVKKAENVLEEPKLLDQLTTGITQKLTKGTGDFTMKLRPEALGEITVKFMEKDGKTAVTILTASAQTAKLINQDLSALREVLRPLQVEVRDATVQQTAQTPEGQMSFDMAGQQFSDRRQDFGSSENPVYYAHTQESQEEEVVQAAVQELSASGLNITI